MREINEKEYEEMKQMEEPTEPSAKIPWCSLGYTVAESKEKCPLGGCWKYRCYKSLLNARWHDKKEEHDALRFG